MQRFAEERGLEYYTDEKHNVIIIKEASAGYESEPPIILQGHMDMVTEKTADCQKDMTKEGLDLYIDGDWLRARGNPRRRRRRGTRLCARTARFAHPKAPAP